MIVEIRHINDERGTELGNIKPSQIKPLIQLLKDGLPVYEYGETEVIFEDAKYYGSQLISYENDGYVFEVIVE